MEVGNREAKGVSTYIIVKWVKLFYRYFRSLASTANIAKNFTLTKIFHLTVACNSLQVGCH